MSKATPIAASLGVVFLCCACNDTETPKASASSTLIVVLDNVPNDIGGDAELFVQTQNGASLVATAPSMAGARLETEGNGVTGVTVYIPSAIAASPGAGYYAVLPAGLAPTGTLAVNAWSYRDGLTPVGLAGAINSADVPPPDAAIGGIVMDPATNQPVSGAIVWIGLDPDQIDAATTTDAQGAYQLLVRPGVYAVTVSTPASSLTQAVDATKGSVQLNASATPGVPAAANNVIGTVIAYPDGATRKPVAGATITFGGQTVTTNAAGEFAIQAPMGMHILQASAPDFRTRGHLFGVGLNGVGRPTVRLHSLCPPLYGTWYLSAAEWLVTGGYNQGAYTETDSPELWTFGADGQYFSQLDNWFTKELDRSPDIRGGWHCITNPDGTLFWTPLDYRDGWKATGTYAVGMHVHSFTPSASGTIEGSQFGYRYKRYAKQGAPALGTCPSLACGGSPEGSWRSEPSVCVDGDPDALLFAGAMLTNCDGAVQSTNFAVNETIQISGSAIAVTEGPTVDVIRLKLKPTCFLSLFESALDASSCAAAGPRLNESRESDESVTCQMNGADCDCTLTNEVNPSGLTERGTYSISGNTLSYDVEATDGSGSSATLQFCVDGNKLYMGSAGPGSPTTVVTTYVRQ